MRQTRYERRGRAEMQLIIPLMLGGCVVAIVVRLLLGVRPATRGRWSARWIRERQAPITPELRREVEDVRWRQHVGGLIGGLVGLAVLIPVSLRFDAADDGSLLPFQAVGLLPFVLIFVGVGLSGIVGAIRELRGPVRVASSRAHRLTDFVSRPGLIAMRVQMIVLVVGGASATLMPAWAGVALDPLETGFLWGTVIVVAVMWLMAEVVGRRLVSSPLPSDDGLTLFWRTALRGDRLREIYRLPGCLGYVAPGVISGAIPRLYGTPALQLGPSLIFAFTLVVLGLTLANQLLLMQAPDVRHRRAMPAAAPETYEPV